MRRTGAAFGVLALVTTMTGCWVQPAFDAGRSSWNPDETTLTSANVHLLTERWDAPMPSVDSVLAPVSVSDIVYATNRAGAAAFDAVTGTRLWTQSVDSEENGYYVDLGAPAWHRGALLVPTSQFPRYGTITKLSPADGTVIGTDDQQVNGSVFELAVADGDVAVSSGWLTSDLSGLATISWDGHWGTSIPVLSGSMPAMNFAVVGDRIQLTGGWTVQSYSSVCVPFPPPYEDLPWCAPNWFVSLGGTPTPPVGIGTTQVVYGDSTGTVTVFDTATGDVAWSAELGAGITRKPAVAGGNILVATDDGRLVALPAAGCGASCTPLWSASLGAAPSTGPVVGGDVAYIGVGGDLAAFARDGCGHPTCPELTRVSTGTSPVTGGPIVHDGRLVAGTGDGHLVAFGLPG